MNKKQREALILALAEKDKTYKEIAKEADASPNMIKAVLNKAGIDQNIYPYHPVPLNFTFSNRRL